MERLVVKNFGPIQQIEISVPRLLVLIGEQASGKSTIGRLIYVFKRISGLFETSLRFSTNTLNSDGVIKFALQMLSEFDDSFFCDSTEISYYYSSDYYITVSSGQMGKCVSLSKEFEDAVNAIHSSFQTIHPTEDGKIAISEDVMREMSIAVKKHRELATAVHCSQVYEYMKAARNICLYTGEFSTPLPNISAQMFEQLEGHLAEIADLSEMKANFVKKSLETDKDFQAITEFCKTHNDSRNYELSYKEYRSRYEKVAENYASVAFLAKDILKGVLRNTEEKGWGFSVRGSRNKVFVPYSALSSGQLSALPIVVLLDNMAASFTDLPFNSAVIEEPEAHIYPNNQFKMIELLANVMSVSRESQFVITTHSPYILASIHALTMYGLSEKKTHLAELDKYKYLCPLDIDENSLGMYLIKDGVAYSMRDAETGLFDTSEIDRVSDDINCVFNLSSLNTEE